MVARTGSEPLWTELARCPLPWPAARLWPVFVELIEHPERFDAGTARAEVLDQDAQQVLRRRWAESGEHCLEWIRALASEPRVEVRRRGERWSWAQCVREQRDGAWLVLEVSDTRDARLLGGVDSGWAERVLARTLQAAQVRCSGAGAQAARHTPTP